MTQHPIIDKASHYGLITESMMYDTQVNCWLLIPLNKKLLLCMKFILLLGGIRVLQQTGNMAVCFHTVRIVSELHANIFYTNI